ncbi:MAG: hypothetical protein JSS02_20720 [Planctomycetes bacterium]|nr:hypothetical protein [Planctomycetota bacterium]
MDHLARMEFVARAEQIYHQTLGPLLEPDHADEFVVIEPESGDHFLGKTLGEASQAARKAHPDRLTHAMRVGQRTALHLGMQCR